MELRAVLEWDADQANLDLVERDPLGMLRADGLMGEGPGYYSGNITDGYGPEASSMVGLLPGKYF